MADFLPAAAPAALPAQIPSSGADALAAAAPRNAAPGAATGMPFQTVIVRALQELVQHLDAVLTSAGTEEGAADGGEGLPLAGMDLPPAMAAPVLENPLAAQMNTPPWRRMMPAGEMTGKAPVDVAAALVQAGPDALRDEAGRNMPDVFARGAAAGFSSTPPGIVAGRTETLLTAASPAVLQDLTAIPGFSDVITATRGRETDVPVVTTLSGAGAEPGAARDTRVENAVPLAVRTPVQSSGWNEDFSHRVAWLVKQDIQAADIKLNPPHLGPLEVRVSLANDQVSIAFNSHHAMVRDAVESAIPRLRELFASNGMDLVNVNISDGSAARHQQGNPGGQTGQDGNGGQRTAVGSQEEAETIALENSAVLSLERMVDIYA